MWSLKCRKAVFSLVVVFVWLSLPAVGAKVASADQLDPLTVPKYVTPLVIPPVMPPVSSDSNLTQYQIAVKQLTQQVLPSGFPRTTVWGYGAANMPDPGLP
jgi:spore coat protein A